MSDNNNFDARFFQVAGNELNKLRAEQATFSTKLSGIEMNSETKV